MVPSLTLVGQPAPVLLSPLAILEPFLLAHRAKVELLSSVVVKLSLALVAETRVLASMVFNPSVAFSGSAEPLIESNSSTLGQSYFLGQSINPMLTFLFTLKIRLIFQLVFYLLELELELILFISNQGPTLAISPQ